MLLNDEAIDSTLVLVDRRGNVFGAKSLRYITSFKRDRTHLADCICGMVDTSEFAVITEISASFEVIDDGGMVIDGATGDGALLLSLVIAVAQTEDLFGIGLLIGIVGLEVLEGGHGARGTTCKEKR